VKWLIFFERRLGMDKKNINKKMNPKVCPKCGSRATKIFNISTGFHKCQICQYEYKNTDALDKVRR
jgi:ribosomal protein L37AE/L43A